MDETISFDFILTNDHWLIFVPHFFNMNKFNMIWSLWRAYVSFLSAVSDKKASWRQSGENFLDVHSISTSLTLILNLLIFFKQTGKKTTRPRSFIDSKNSKKILCHVKILDDFQCAWFEFIRMWDVKSGYETFINNKRKANTQERILQKINAKNSVFSWLLFEGGYFRRCSCENSKIFMTNITRLMFMWWITQWRRRRIKNICFSPNSFTKFFSQLIIYNHRSYSVFGNWMHHKWQNEALATDILLC